MKKKTKQWSASYLISFLFLLGTIGTIYLDYKLPVENNKLITQKQSLEYIKEAKQKIIAPNEADYFIPTGIYLESLIRLSKNTVKGVGYIWQELDTELPTSASGFILPNAFDVTISKIIENVKDDKRFLVWHFEASFIKNC